jgi:hypothetical protein
MEEQIWSSLACLGFILLPAIVGLRLVPEWPKPSKPRAEKIIELDDGTRGRIYDPGQLAAYERDLRDYYA